MNYWFELKYTLRLMRKKLSFTALSVFVIAVGIGISIPLVSMTKFFGIQPLPVENGDRFVVLKQEVQGQQNLSVIDPFVYRRIKQNVNNYESIGAFQSLSAILSDGETTEAFAAVKILPETLDLLPVTPLLGRSLQASDDLSGAAPVAVISYQLWQSYYAGAQEIVGLQSRINGETYTVVGVMPENFSYPIAHDLWLPLQLGANPEPGGIRNLNVVGLMNDGIGHRAASVELNSVLQSLAEEFPEFYSGVSGVVMSYPLITMNDGPIFGQLMMGIVVTVLLLVCFNVANLLSVRNSERVSELAIRGALGGTLWRIMAQVLMESFLICIFAAVLGLAIGNVALAVIENGVLLYPGGLPFWVSFDIQAYDILVLFIVTLSVWLLSGLFPAWQIARQDISTVLGSDSGSVAGGMAGRATRLLVTVEIIASCFLLIICMSFVIGLYQASHMDMGIDSEGFLSAKVDLSSASYAGAEDKLLFLQELESEILDFNQFEEIAYATALAGQNPRRLSYGLEDRDLSTDGRYPLVGLNWTSSNYANLMGISVLAGRYFDFGDSATSMPVTVVDELFVERFWPGESATAALGKRVQLEPGRSGEWLTVIGVINHIIQGQPTAERLYQSTLYRHFTQLPAADSSIRDSVRSVSMAVATTGLASNPMSDYEQMLKTAASRVDRGVPMTDVMTLSRSKYLIMEAVNTTADIMLWVSVVTLILAVVGIYGVVSRSVLSRGKEIGIRRALGSSNFKIINIFIKQGSRFLLLGALIGGMGGILVVNAITGATGSQSSSYGYALLIAVPIIFGLGLLVFVASYLPARKLIAFEPGEALHYE